MNSLREDTKLIINFLNLPISSLCRFLLLLIFCTQKLSSINGVVAQNKIVDIEAGDYFILALKDDGTIWSWGINSQGQLGRGYISKYDSIPQQIGADRDWVKIFANGNRSIAIKKDSSIWAWGMNSNSELGVGDEYAITFPRRFGEHKKWKTVCMDHSIFIVVDANGSALCNLGWGRNSGYYETTRYSIEEINSRYGGLSFRDTSGMFYFIPDVDGYGAAPFGKVKAFDDYNGRCAFVDQNNDVYAHDTLDCEGEYHVVHRKVMENVRVKKLNSKLDGKYLLEEDGKLWYWGCNRFGYSGLGYKKVVEIPIRIAPHIKWVDIAFLAADIPLLLSDEGHLYIITANQFTIEGIFTKKQCPQPCIIH